MCLRKEGHPLNPRDQHGDVLHALVTLRPVYRSSSSRVHTVKPPEVHQMIDRLIAAFVTGEVPGDGNRCYRVIRKIKYDVNGVKRHIRSFSVNELRWESNPETAICRATGISHGLPERCVRLSLLNTRAGRTPSVPQKTYIFKTARFQCWSGFRSVPGRKSKPRSCLRSAGFSQRSSPYRCLSPPSKSKRFRHGRP